jgi:hypothetical protein
MPHTVAGQDSHPGEGCGHYQRHRPERLLGSSITIALRWGRRRGVWYSPSKTCLSATSHAGPS